MSLEIKLKPNYKQPHNIHYHTGNEARDYHLRMKEHNRQKHNKSKWSKRFYKVTTKSIVITK